MKTTPHSVLFWRTKDIYSNWHVSPFTLAGVNYSCVEQYMMAAKARLFGDLETEAKILAVSAKDPKRMKDLGRLVKGYVEEVWVAHREQIVYDACLAKFEQDKDLGDQLHSTLPRRIIEASPYDRIWGIGMDETDPRAEDPSQWQGLNLLGIALMRVRETLSQRRLARLYGREAPADSPVPLTVVPPALAYPTTEDARVMGQRGAAHSERERELFEAYMKGHCWAVGEWDAEKGCYTDHSSRVFWALWRDRGALAYQVAAGMERF